MSHPSDFNTFTCSFLLSILFWCFTSLAINLHTAPQPCHLHLSRLLAAFISFTISFVIRVPVEDLFPFPLLEVFHLSYIVFLKSSLSAANRSTFTQSNPSSFNILFQNRIVVLLPPRGMTYSLQRPFLKLLSDRF